MQGLTAQQVGAVAPQGGFQDNGWYNGYNYDAASGTFAPTKGQNWSVNNPAAKGSMVSQQVNNQSAAAQGISPQQFNQFLQTPATPTTPQGANLGGQPQGTIPGATPTTTATTATPTSDALTAAQAKIDNINKQISDKQQAAANAEKTENDNPFYSESSRVGRIKKIQDSLNADLTPLQQQLSIAQSEYDNTQKAQADAAKMAAPNNEVVQSTDANGNVTLLTIDKKTGNIVSQNTIAGIGKTGKVGSSKATTAELIPAFAAQITQKLNKTGQIDPQTWRQALANWEANGGTAKDFVDNFGQYADHNRGDFYSAYGFKNPNPVWSEQYPGRRIGETITDANGQQITIKE